MIRTRMIVLAVCLGVSTIQAKYCHHKSRKTVYTKITTIGNTVGIPEDEDCYYYQDKKGNYHIICSWRTFKNSGVAESALTGTPGHIMYKNYIGTVEMQPSEPGLLGSGKRLDFCDGECVLKE
jgi:hypothetical protein